MDYTDIIPEMENIISQIRNVQQLLHKTYDNKFTDGTAIIVEAVIKNLDNAVHDIELSEAVLNVVEEKFEELIRN